MGESWDIPNTDQAHLNDWPEETRKKRPIKVIKTARRCNLVTLWACLCVHPHYSFPPNKHFTSLAFSVGIIFCKAEKPGSCHWGRPPSLAGNQSPFSSCCRQRSLEIIAVLPFCCGTILLPWKNKQKPPKQKKQTQFMKFGHEQQKSLEIVGAQHLGLSG